MKWLTEWWGVAFLAETDAEAAVLEEFAKLLPDEPEHDYDEGRVEVRDGPYESQWHKVDCVKALVVSR